MLNLILHLPRASHFVEAYAQDDEVAAVLGLPDGKRVERMSEWTPEREVGADIFDRLGTLISVEMQMNGNKNPRLKPYPRPVTATQRLMDSERKRQHDWLSERLYPKPE